MKWRTFVGKNRQAGDDLDDDARQHEFLCRLIDTTCTFDQLQPVNLASSELIFRQLQLVEERVYEAGVASSARASKGKDKGKSDVVVGAYDAVESSLYLGTSETKGNLCICPALQEWIAEQLKAEAAVAKERRKARDERAGRV